MALGALTLPTIQSSFASGSSAMLPTISNMASVQKMSALDSMQEVFFDIREGIVNLSKVFAEKISGLNTHLAFRLDKLNNTMSKIASVAVKDLSLEEEKQDEIDVINRNANIQASETVDDIGDVGQGTTMLDSLKRFFEKFKSDGGESSILKLALMAGALFLLSKFSDKLLPIITATIKFVKETLIPGLNKLLGFIGLDLKTALTGLLAAVVLWKFVFSPLTGLAIRIGTGIALLGKGLAALVPSMFQLGVATGTLRNSFMAMRLFIGTTLPAKLLLAYGGFNGFLEKAFTNLGKAFLALRVFMTATLIPAITGIVTSMAAFLSPILIPIAVIAGIAAVIAGVLFSIKSGFEVFKKSVEDGDSMLVAIAKGIGDFAATLVTLPITLLKNIVGYIAGLFGFDSFKEKLDGIDFKESLKDNIVGFITKVFNFIADGVKGMANAVIDKLNLIPGVNIAKLNLSTDKVVTSADGTTTLPGTKVESLKNITEINTRLIRENNTMKEKTNELKFAAATKANNVSTNINIVKGGNTTNSVTNQSAITTADAAINHSDTTSSDLLSQVS